MPRCLAELRAPGGGAAAARLRCGAQPDPRHAVLHQETATVTSTAGSSRPSTTTRSCATSSRLSSPTGSRRPCRRSSEKRSGRRRPCREEGISLGKLAAHSRWTVRSRRGAEQREARAATSRTSRRSGEAGPDRRGRPAARGREDPPDPSRPDRPLHCRTRCGRDTASPFPDVGAGGMTVGSITAHFVELDPASPGSRQPLAPPRDYLPYSNVSPQQFLEARRRFVADRNAGEEHHLDRTRAGPRDRTTPHDPRVGRVLGAFG